MILGATASVIFVVVVVIATVVCLITVGCKQCKKRSSHATVQPMYTVAEVALYTTGLSGTRVRSAVQQI